jgi:hypothetical protein
LSIAIENWLDRERDQLPLWLPVGIGIGGAIWEFGGASAAMFHVEQPRYGRVVRRGAHGSILNV